MKLNYKIFFKCLLNKINFSFINNLSQAEKNYNLLVAPKALYYSSLHLRMASAFYSTQLVDIFSYEVPTYANPKAGDSSKYSFSDKQNSTVVVYNYHSLMSQDRFFLFTQTSLSSDQSYSFLPSITELFSAANWLEREASELSGVSFSGKKDLRNLMLQYGDSSAPFQKSFPSVGLREMFYDPLKDTIIQNAVTVQL